MQQQKQQQEQQQEQHFLVSPSKIQTIVDHADIKDDDHVVEIGAGMGTVATHIARKARHVTVVELDRTLCNVLRGHFEPARVHEGDAIEYLRTEENIDIVISNLPSSLTRSVLDSLEQHRRVRRAVIAMHENDEVKYTSSTHPSFQFATLCTLFGEDFDPPQPFNSKLVLVTRT